MTIRLRRFFRPFVRDILATVADPTLLLPIFTAWAMSCSAVGALLLRHAPTVSLAVLGSVCGAVAGFLIGNADGPAEVPAYTAMGASIGLFANGALAMLATTARPPSAPLRRAATVILLVGPIAAAVLAMLLQVACPLYVTGRRTGFCNYQYQDQLGGWISGVVLAFLFDAWFVAGLLLVAARQALRKEDALDPKWRRLAAGG